MSCTHWTRLLQLGGIVEILESLLPAPKMLWTTDVIGTSLYYKEAFICEQCWYGNSSCSLLILFLSFEFLIAVQLTLTMAISFVVYRLNTINHVISSMTATKIWTLLVILDSLLCILILSPTILCSCSHSCEISTGSLSSVTSRNEVSLVIGKD